MIALLINLLILILILGLMYTLIMWVIGIAGLPAPIGKVVQVVFAIIILLWILDFLAGGAHVRFYRW